MPLSHLAWPYQLGATVEQDTISELQASAAVALCTPRGTRPDDDTFGVTSALFQTLPLDIDDVARELGESDGRLDASVTDLSTLIDATVARLNVDLTHGE